MPRPGGQNSHPGLGSSCGLGDATYAGCARLQRVGTGSTHLEGLWDPTRKSLQVWSARSPLPPPKPVSNLPRSFSAVLLPLPLGPGRPWGTGAAWVHAESEEASLRRAACRGEGQRGKVPAGRSQVGPQEKLSKTLPRRSRDLAFPRAPTSERLSQDWWVPAALASGGRDPQEAECGGEEFWFKNLTFRPVFTSNRPAVLTGRQVFFRL